MTVWSTGFTPEFGLLEVPYALTSSFLGGVGRDAAYRADRVDELGHGRRGPRHPVR